MPQQTKIFRVFVSSTFADMKEERELLQKSVFPQLEKFCEERGAKFQAVDLRWGVNEESQLNQKTLDICLNEIARCQRISPKPNFLILLGDRYGWQPVPVKIPELEMNQIREQLAPEGMSLIEKWYWLDENAVPPEYILQNREGEYREYSSWESIEKQIRSVLRAAVDQLSFSIEQRIKYFTSATHQEIIHGALNPPESAERPEEHVFAFSRETNGLPQDASAKDFRDLDGEKPDEYCNSMLADLKKELETKLGSHFIPYSANWQKNRSVMDDPESFKNSVYTFFKDIIEQQLKEVISPNEIDHEVRLHGEFKARLTEHFRGRKESLEQIQTYLESNEKQTFSLIGASGSGKSSVMAEAIRRFEVRHPHHVLVYRFIGTTSGLTNLISLLLSICGQIAREYETTLKALSGEGNEKALTELNGLTSVFAKCLTLATSEKPITLFLDALDQLSDVEKTPLYWLKNELPEHAKVVVSVLPELAGVMSGTCILQLPLLPVLEANQILEVWFTSIQRTLTREQFDELTTKFALTGLPIYLRLAFELARHWYSYDEHYSLQEDVSGIVNGFLDDLEKEHTKELVQRILSYMLCGRYGGLTEDEILEILVFDREFWDKIYLPNTRPEHRQALAGATKIPTIVWSRLFLDLEPFLTERSAPGCTVVSFYHRQLTEPAAARVLAGDVGRLRHRSLAEYFAAQPNWFDSDQKQPNARKAAELVYHQLAGEQWKELEETLTDLPFLEAKVVAGMTFELPADFRQAVNALSIDRPQRRILKLLDEAIRRDIHFIACHAEDYPQALFQCAWNHGWWYDSPEAAKQHKPSTGDSPTTAWSRHGPKLYEVLEQWRCARISTRWLRSLRPPEIALGSAQTAVLPGRIGPHSVEFSRDGRRILAANNDVSGESEVWDTATGMPLLRLRGHENDVYSATFSQDGSRIATAGADGRICIWCAISGVMLKEIRCGEGWVTSVRFSKDDCAILSAHRDGQVALRSLDTRAVVRCYRDLRVTIARVEFSPDGRQIAGSSEGNLHIWDSDNGRLLLRTPEVDWPRVVLPWPYLPDICYSPDGKNIAYPALDATVRVIDTASGDEILHLGETDRCDIAWAVKYSPDGRMIAVATDYAVIQLWDSRDGTSLGSLYGHEDSVTCLSFSSDGRTLASGSGDGTVRLWDLTTDRVISERTWYMRDTERMVVVADKTRVLGVCDEWITMWNLRTLKLLRKLRSFDDIKTFTASPDGCYLASISERGALELMDISEGRTTLIVDDVVKEEEVGCLSFSRCSSRLVVAGAGRVAVYSMATAGRLATDAIPENVKRLSHSRDGAVLFGDHEHGVIVRRAVDAGQLVDDWALLDADVSLDGRQLAGALRDGTVRIWSLPAMAEIRRIDLCRSPVCCVSFSADGSRLVGVSQDGMLAVFDAASGREVWWTVVAEQHVRCVAFTSDDQAILGVHADHQVSVWDAGGGSLKWTSGADSWQGPKELAVDGSVGRDTARLLSRFHLLPLTDNLEAILVDPDTGCVVMAHPSAQFWLVNLAFPVEPIWLAANRLIPSTCILKIEDW